VLSTPQHPRRYGPEHDVPSSSMTGNDSDDYIERQRKSADRHITNTLQILSAVIPALIRDFVP